MRIHALFLCFFIVAIAMVSCKKDDRVSGTLTPQNQPAPPPPPTPTPAAGPGTPHSLTVKFIAFANGEPMVPASRTYTNESGDSLTVTKFTYYISNLKFFREDGSYFGVTDGYYLIRHVEGNSSFTIDSIPDGKYTRVSFLIGVDSIRNVSGAQSGALDPVHGMFWDWDTGYIFYKLEGSYRSTQMTAGHDYAIHVGGFSGKDHCLRTSTLSFPAAVNLQRNSSSKLDIRANVEEVFVTPTPMGFEDYYAAVPNGPRIFSVVADNYSDMFTIVKVEVTPN
jgi:hypothetical protein